MTKSMLIDAAHLEETRILILEDKKIEDLDFESSTKEQLRGNIYLAKIIRVEPSLQAAFVDYGAQRHGFLAYNEIHPDYFKIPTSDKEKILAEEHRNSSRYSEDSTEEDDIDINQNKYIESDSINAIGKKSFLDRVIDFFNYKPSDDKELFEEVELKKHVNKFSKKIKSQQFRTIFKRWLCFLWFSARGIRVRIIFSINNIFDFIPGEGFSFQQCLGQVFKDIAIRFQ